VLLSWITTGTSPFPLLKSILILMFINSLIIVFLSDLRHPEHITRGEALTLMGG
jgi:hypothetical protein